VVVTGGRRRETDRRIVRMISKADREELGRVIKIRMKAAKSVVDQRKAELLADVEGQLSAQYEFDDEMWAEITRRAEEVVTQADERVAAICRENGIPEQFRPQLHLGWYRRGENAAAERRAELRKLAERKIEAAAKGALATIEMRSADMMAQLIAGGLESAEAKAFLESIPTPMQLMPPVVVAELENGKPLRVDAED
jgi:hypothetical protein